MERKGRNTRVAELVREEIARLLMKGVKDPRIGFVSVMSVRMSPDLKYANIYMSLFGDEKVRKSSLVGLQQAASWMRGQVARNLKLRHAPELRFFPDETLDRVFHLEEVFRELNPHDKTVSEGGETSQVCENEEPQNDSI